MSKKAALLDASDAMLSAALDDLGTLTAPQPQATAEETVPEPKSKPKAKTKAQPKEQEQEVPPPLVEEEREEEGSDAACLIALPPKKKQKEKGAILIRLPIEEKAIVERLADERGMSTSAFCAAVLHALVQQACKK